VREVAYAPASPAFAGGAAALISCGVCSWWVTCCLQPRPIASRLSNISLRSALAGILFCLKHSASDAAAPHAPSSAPQPVTSSSIDFVAAEKQEQTTAARAPSTLTKQQALLFALEFVSGFLFGSGLVVAGMVNPSKVQKAPPVPHVIGVAHSFPRSLHFCLLFPQCASIKHESARDLVPIRPLPATGSTPRWRSSWAEQLQSPFLLFSTLFDEKCCRATTSPCELNPPPCASNCTAILTILHVWTTLRLPQENCHRRTAAAGEQCHVHAARA
jgi:hypothetical protein